MFTARGKIVSVQSPKKEAALRETAVLLSRVETWQFGLPRSLSHRFALIEDGGQRMLSFWHDLPLYGTDNLLSCICATPAGTCAQYEVATDEPFNPLRIVSSGGSGISIPSVAASNNEVSNNKTVAQPLSGWQKVRMRLMNCHKPVPYSANVPWNISILPQTSTSSPLNTKQCGSPVEVVEIGADRLRKSGETYMVKPLGAFFVEVPGEDSSWKIIAIAEDDALMHLLNDTCDIQAHLPGLLDDIRSWLQIGSGRSSGGIKSGRVTVSHRPAKLSCTLAKIAEFHEAWCHVPNNRDWLDPFSTVPLRETVTPAYLEKLWKPYMKPGANLRSIPLSVASPEALLQFDLAWFEGTKSGGPGHLPCMAPSAAAKLPPLGKNITLTKSKKGLGSIWAKMLHKEKERYGGDLEHSGGPLELPDDIAISAPTAARRLTTGDMPRLVTASKNLASVQNSGQIPPYLPCMLTRSVSVRIAASDKDLQVQKTFLDLV